MNELMNKQNELTIENDEKMNEWPNKYNEIE